MNLNDILLRSGDGSPCKRVTASHWTTFSQFTNPLDPTGWQVSDRDVGPEVLRTVWQASSAPGNGDQAAGLGDKRSSSRIIRVGREIPRAFSMDHRLSVTVAHRQRKRWAGGWSGGGATDGFARNQRLWEPRVPTSSWQPQKFAGVFTIHPSPRTSHSPGCTYSSGVKVDRATACTVCWFQSRGS